MPTTRRPLVLVSIMAALFMIAVEATIVSTAMPQIAGQLGDLHLYAWVFAAFLLTQTATTVVFGKLADLFGRRPVLLAGIAIFLAGSVLCGFAWSIPVLVAFRLLQGVGAGAIQPVCMTVVGDLYPGAQRGKVQGYLASVWGVSSVLGPLAGGLIVQHLSWAWVFWVNVPVGLAAMVGFMLYLHEGVVRGPRRVDVAGAVLFTASVSALVFALTETGAGHVGASLAAGGVFVLFTAAFLVQERRAPEPMMALGLWTRRPIAAANGTSLLAGMTIIGLTAFLPMYVQGVLGRSALVAGFATTMMVLGWPIGATLTAKYFPRYGLRPILTLGALLLPVGSVLFVLLTPASSPVLAGAGSLVTGLGMGLLSTAAIVIVQDSVRWAERGAATASNLFARNLGSTVGAAAFGAVLNIGMGPAGSGTGPERVRALLERGAGAVDPAVQLALGHALHLTFWAVLLVSAAAVLVPHIPLPAREPAEAAKIPAE